MILALVGADEGDAPRHGRHVGVGRVARRRVLPTDYIYYYSYIIISFLMYIYILIYSIRYYNSVRISTLE